MKSNKGISLITLVIMIIVIILVTSITVYEGIKVGDQSRQLIAVERLKLIADAVISHEQELGYAEMVVSNASGDFVQIGVNDYYIMGLQDFADTSNFPPVLLRKSIDTIDSTKKIYELKTPKLVRKTGVYKDDDYVEYKQEFFEDKTDEHYKIEFDTVKGVNRPILTSDMIPVKTFFSSSEDPIPVIVNDMYTEDWYNYTTDAPMWANVMIKNSGNVMYVWIPRFAYRIQTFYISTNYDDIPKSAIEIAFLKGTSDLMANDDVLPTGFQVHPAFKYKDQKGNKVELPGFWVAKRNIDFADSIVSGSGIIASEEVELSNLHPNMNASDVESRLIKNSEWAAIAYLSLHSVGRTTNGNSLNYSASGVLELNQKCFVAGGLKSVVQNTLPYADRYVIPDENTVSYESYEGYSGDAYGSGRGRKFGDAIIATSTGLDETSSWFRGTSIRITNSKPYILRGLDNNLFSYDASENSPDRGAMYRNVLIVKSR